MSFKVVFMGTPQFAVPSLNALLHGPDDVVAVVTQPDRRSGRGRRVQPSPVKERALQAGIPIFDPVSVRDVDFQSNLEAFAPEFIVTAAFGQILPREILDLPTLGCLNVHASLLPKYRGAAPIHQAILNGESSTGVTIIRMNERLDAGDILMAHEVPIYPDEDTSQLTERLAQVGAQVLMKTLRGLEVGAVKPKPQREDEASYAPRLKKEDGEIQWSQPAEEIVRRIRAMTPWPGAYTYWQGKRLKLHKARAVALDRMGEPGEVIRADSDGLWVQTGDGLLEILEIQTENRPRMPSSAFLSGHGKILGDRLGS